MGAAVVGVGLAVLAVEAVGLAVEVVAGLDVVEVEALAVCFAGVVLGAPLPPFASAQKLRAFCVRCLSVDMSSWQERGPEWRAKKSVRGKSQFPFETVTMSVTKLEEFNI